MFNRVWLWAGQIRTTQLNLGSPAHQIQTDLHGLLEDLRYWEDSDMAYLEQTARLHHRAVQIHPFQNGNGRWARLLANIRLKQQTGHITAWPDQGITDGVSAIREEYLATLRDADQGDYGPLVGLHRTYYTGE